MPSTPRACPKTRKHLPVNPTRPSAFLALLAAAILVSGCSVGTPERGTTSAPAVSASAVQTPPPPSVVVAKGDSAEGQPGCFSSACAYVTTATAGFSGDVSCSVASTRGSDGFVSWTQGPAETTQSPNYFGYPDATVTVTCSGAGETATGSLTW